MALTQADIARIKGRITRVLQANGGVAPSVTLGLLPTKSLQGKLYEADVLATICENLVRIEGFQIVLSKGTIVQLKQKGGPVNRNYPYFEVNKGAKRFGELFTDIYFNTLSYQRKGGTGPLGNGDYHELDIAILEPGTKNYPQVSEIILAVECKNTSIEKNIIREVLGFRRELAYASNIPQPTKFTKWPAANVLANPNSLHMLYCSDSRISRYISNCQQFGIDLVHHVM